jgi:hypothetical protein
MEGALSVWTLLQVLVDLVLAAGFIAMWWRLRRPPQDDPRLSRGLQLLQTKITVLEDLSDRTDAQVKQLSNLLDHKTRTVQNKILEAEEQVLKIDHSMHKSLEVAEIFQDKIPHQEILERQRTVEYVKAARMAHSGLSVEEISQSVHLPREQIELIAKFNREQLMFDESQLPEWATRPSSSSEPPNFVMSGVDFVGGLEPVKTDLSQIAKIEDDFKRAVRTAKEIEANPPPSLMDSKVAETLRASVQSGMDTMQPAVMSIKATAQTFKDKLVSTAEDLLRQQAAVKSAAPAAPSVSAKSDKPIVRKVIFPKIEKSP